MKLEEIVKKRSEGNCELCKSMDNLKMYEVLSPNGTTEENCIMICVKCTAQIDKKEELDSKHWQCLTESMWSEVPGVQVVAWRMLNRLRNESWAMDNLDMLYLDDEKLAWAKTTGDHENDSVVDLHKDIGDSDADLNNDGEIDVSEALIVKSLDVKGSTINAKLGTVVRNIRLVENNTEQIEGRVEGQVIVILTKYVKKQH